MTIKYLTGAYPGGYALSPDYTGLVIESAASVGGAGVSVAFKAAITNLGTVSATSEFGVYLTAGGTVTNGSAMDKTALISAQYGVWAQYGSATVANFGTIQGGIFLRFGGGVTNGAAKDVKALIDGVYSRAASASVTNFGTIQDNVNLTFGGSVTNGSATNFTALISGVSVEGKSAKITNLGTIKGARDGVVLTAGGTVTNGSTADVVALIQAAKGSVGNDCIYAQNTYATVANYGTILGGEATAVNLSAGGRVTNGSATDTQALIHAMIGVVAANLDTSVSIANFGTIRATIGPGVSLAGDGSVTNGSAADTSALISGVSFGFGALANYGAISGEVNLREGGTVLNGSAADTTALIAGPIGVYALYGGAEVTNFGTIQGARFAGAFLANGGTVTNGSATDATALISGGYGVYVGQTGATVTNFATFDGTGGVAVSLGSDRSQLDVEAGSTFVGAVLGYGGTLDLASGTGMFVLSAGGDVTVSGSMAPTTFQNFNTVEVGAGATFTDTGAVTLAAGLTVSDAGTLTLGAAGAGSVANAGLIETTGAGALTLAGAVDNAGTLAADGGTLTVDGAVTGAGKAVINGATLDFASSFAQNVTFTGTTGRLDLAQSQGYTGTITGFSRTVGTFLDLGDIGFVSTGEASFSGTRTGGVLTVTDGTHTAAINLSGNYLGSKFVAESDGLGGVIIFAEAKRASSAPPHAFIAAMARLGGAAGGAIHTHDVGPVGAPMLARPHTMIA
jgi:fibronectin-binding autotransporter adhesin